MITHQYWFIHCDKGTMPTQGTLGVERMGICFHSHSPTLICSKTEQNREKGLQQVGVDRTERGRWWDPHWKVLWVLQERRLATCASSHGVHSTH